MYLFHGTSYSNGLQILKEGFSPKSKIWDCSSDSKTYFYKSKSLDNGIQNALDQSLISVGLNNESKALVLVFDANKVKNQSPDSSCVGMNKIAVEAQITSLDGLIGVYAADNLFFESKKSLVNCSINPLIKMNSLERVIYKVLNNLNLFKYKKKNISFKKKNF